MSPSKKKKKKEREKKACWDGGGEQLKEKTKEIIGMREKGE